MTPRHYPLARHYHLFRTPFLACICWYSSVFACFALLHELLMEAAPVESTVAVTAAAEGSAETSSMADASLLAEAFSGNALAIASRVLLGTIAESSSEGISAALAAAASRGHLQAVTSLIDDERAVQTLHDGKALRAAAAGGHIAIVAVLWRLMRRLLPLEASSPLCEAAVAAAAARGRDDIMWYLLEDPHVHFTAASIDAVVAAAGDGFSSMEDINRKESAALRLLADPRIDAAAAIRQLLVEPAVDVKWKKYALTWAAANGDIETISLSLAQDDWSVRCLGRLNFAYKYSFDVVRQGCHHPTVPQAWEVSYARHPQSRDPRCVPADVLPIHCSRAMFPRDFWPPSRSASSSRAGTLGASRYVMPRQGAPLTAAAASGHVDVMRRLLDDPRLAVDPAARHNEALIAAAAWGQAAAVDFLLTYRRGRNANAAPATASEAAEADIPQAEAHIPQAEVDPAARGNEALLWACYGGHIAVVHRLLADPRVDPSARCQAAVIAAAAQGHAAVVERLQADPRVVLTARNGSAYAAAAAHGHVAVMDLLQARGISAPPARLEAALTQAALSGHEAAALRLLEDARINPAACSNAPLMAAASAGLPALTAALLRDPRVNPSAIAYDDSALERACGWGQNADVVRFLLADPRVDPMIRGCAALQRAAASGFAEGVAVLLADDRINEPARFRALLAACSSTHDDSAVIDVFLADSRTDPTTRDHAAIHVAACRGNTRVLHRLLADPRVDAAEAEDVGAIEADERACIDSVIPQRPLLMISEQSWDDTRASAIASAQPEAAAAVSSKTFGSLFEHYDWWAPSIALINALKAEQCDICESSADLESEIMRAPADAQSADGRHSPRAGLAGQAWGSSPHSFVTELAAARATRHGDAEAASRSEQAPAPADSTSTLLLHTVLPDLRPPVAHSPLFSRLHGYGDSDVEDDMTIAAASLGPRRYPLSSVDTAKVERLLASATSAASDSESERAMRAVVSRAVAELPGQSYCGDVSDIMERLLAEAVQRDWVPRAGPSRAQCEADAQAKVTAASGSTAGIAHSLPAASGHSTLSVPSADPAIGLPTGLVPRRPAMVEDGYHALIAAAEAGDLATVRRLLACPHVVPISHGNLAVHAAARHGRADVVRFLLSDPRTAPPAALSGFARERDLVVATDAACQQDYEVVCLLLEHHDAHGDGGSDDGASAGAAMSVTEARVRRLLAGRPAFLLSCSQLDLATLSRPRLDVLSLLRATIYPHNSPRDGRGGPPSLIALLCWELRKLLQGTTNAAAQGALALAQLVAFLDTAVQPQVGELPPPAVRVQPWTVPAQPQAAALRRALRSSVCAVHMLLQLMDHPALRAPTSPYSSRRIGSFLSKHLPSFATMRAATWARRRAAVLARETSLHAADE